jgi:hypothetical protein
MAPLSYRRHRFPAEIIQHAIWLYLRFRRLLNGRYRREAADQRASRAACRSASLAVRSFGDTVPVVVLNFSSITISPPRVRVCSAGRRFVPDSPLEGSGFEL